MAETGTRSLRLAVLIDGDNVSPAIADRLFAEVRGLGDPIVRRVYGASLDGWKAAIRKHGLTARLVVANVGKKNAADFDLVIEAMEVLHAGTVGGFCLVSSDSDFTRLASHLRERGLEVYGFGSARAPASLRTAVTEFRELDGKAGAAASKKAAPVKKAPAAKKAPPAAKKTPPAAKKTPPPAAAPGVDEAAILEAIRATPHKDGWASLNALGKALKDSGLRVKHLGDKLRRLGGVEVSGTGNGIRVRIKRS